MNVNELQWVQRQDFSGGLWDRKSERECPENGMLEATDCYPQARGGLRAFMRMEPVSQLGLPTNSLIFQIAKLRPPFPQGRLRVAVLELDGSAVGRHKFGIYSMPVGGDPTLANTSARWQIENGTWNIDAQHNNITLIDSSIQLIAYRDGDFGYRNWYNLPVAQGLASTSVTDYSTAGVYRLGDPSTVTGSTSTVSSGTERRIVTSHNNTAVLSSVVNYWPSALASHQARLIHTATFNQLHNRMYMTSQGGSVGTTDFLDPLGEKAGSLTFLEPSQSDYLVAPKSQTGVLVVQGNMLNPAIRQTSFAHNYIQSFGCATEQGVAYLVQDDACYMATQGGVQNITPNFYGTPMNPGLYPASFNTANSDAIKLLTPTLAGDFLFMGNGYVMDMRTNAWFKSSFTPKSKHHTTDLSFFRVFTAENLLYTGKNQVLHHGYYLENQDTTTDTWNPASSYTFTCPITYNPHQQTSVREIVYHVEAFKPRSSVRVEVMTENGVVFDKTYELTKAGPQPVRASGIKADGNWVKVRTTISSDQRLAAPNEAPLLERLFIGTQKNTRTAQAPRGGL